MFKMIIDVIRNETLFQELLHMTTHRYVLWYTSLINKNYAMQYIISVIDSKLSFSFCFINFNILLTKHIIIHISSNAICVVYFAS